MILTEGQIKAQVRTIRRKANSKPDPVAFALRSDAPWSGATTLSIDGREHRVAFCRSGLELREKLRQARAENELLVALCPFGTDQLEDDVIARLAKRRVHPPETREMLASLFQATAVDPRVFATPALTQGLVENAPAEGYASVPGGVLDLKQAWSALLGRMVGDHEVATNLTRLLEVSLEATSARRLENLPSELRREFFAWVAQNLDPSAAWMAHLVATGRTADLVPVGLLLEVLFSPEQPVGAKLKEARIRLEHWFNGHAIDEPAARNWSAAARLLVQSKLQRDESGSAATGILTRLDVLLKELKVPEAAAGSFFSPAGFELRLRGFAVTLADALEGTTTAAGLPPLFRALEQLRSHVLADEHRRRIERCEMAARLAAWLAHGAALSAGGTLGDSVADYVATGGFVDWARTIVREGNEPELNPVFNRLLARVNQVCDAFEATFALKVTQRL